MGWFTWRRIVIAASSGTGVFLIGFIICKLAGSEAGVSWLIGVRNSLIFGAFIAASILCLKSRETTVRRMFFSDSE